MAIFTAEEFSGLIRCWLDGREVTHLAARIDIPAIASTADVLPAVGYLVLKGSIDIFDTDDEGHIIAGADGFPTLTRHHGTIQLGQLSA